MSRDRVHYTVTIGQDDTFTFVYPGFDVGTTRSYQGTPSGSVIVDNVTYPYLRYKTRTAQYTRAQDGWIVPGHQIEGFFEESLDYMGLHDNEIEDFVSYRGEVFDNNQNYIISFKQNEDLDPYTRLVFDLQPDSVHRVLVEMRRYDNDNDNTGTYDTIYQIGHYDSLTIFDRSSDHDVLEWGGVYSINPHHRVFLPPLLMH